MAHKAETIGQSDYGPRIRVFDEETGEELDLSQPGAGHQWFTAVREAELINPSYARGLNRFMFQNGRKLDDLYGTRAETDRA